MLRTFAALSLLLLGACTTAAPPSGFLSSYEGLKARENPLRTVVSEGRDAQALRAVRTAAIEPTTFVASSELAWMTEGERALLAREIDAQLCFELSERYFVTPGGAGAPAADARVRAAVTAAQPTGRVGSAVSAAAGFFIPGPIGVRAPGTVGALSVEAEMLSPDGRQLAALAWSRAATPIGTDAPSLSRIGDALQFAEPFADDAAKVMSPPEAVSRQIPQPDPCAAYGPRIRPEGFLAKVVTGLYVPQASGARAGPPPPAQPPPAPQAEPPPQP